MWKAFWDRTTLLFLLILHYCLVFRCRMHTNHLRHVDNVKESHPYQDFFSPGTEFKLPGLAGSSKHVTNDSPGYETRNFKFQALAISSSFPPPSPPTKLDGGERPFKRASSITNGKGFNPFPETCILPRYVVPVVPNVIDTNGFGRA